VKRQRPLCAHCSGGLVMRDGWPVHDETGNARCYPHNPLSALLAAVRTPVRPDDLPRIPKEPTR
jgi:hypothetical protein